MGQSQLFPFASFRQRWCKNKGGERADRSFSPGRPSTRVYAVRLSSHDPTWNMQENQARSTLRIGFLRVAGNHVFLAIRLFTKLVQLLNVTEENLSRKTNVRNIQVPKLLNVNVIKEQSVSVHKMTTLQNANSTKSNKTSTEKNLCFHNVRVYKHICTWATHRNRNHHKHLDRTGPSCGAKASLETGSLSMGAASSYKAFCRSIVSQKDRMG
jgi:hypothetical protein